MSYHILLVGSTGVGKSSLIKLFTDDNGIKISNNAKSTTKEISIYEEKKYKRYWIDTVGAEDSDMDKSDEEILNLAQKYIYQSNIKGDKYLKIIWIVGSNNKDTSTLQIQAQFISKFSNSNENIWNSVMIIVSRPYCMTALSECAQGATAAARENGCKNPDNLIIKGFNCIEWNTDEQAKQKLLEMNIDARRPMHLYKLDEIHESINESLSKLSSCLVKFNELQCQICSIQCDPRFCDSPCHIELLLCHKDDKPQMVHVDDDGKMGKKEQHHLISTPVKYHSLPSLHHSGANEYYHLQEITERYHKDGVYYKHPGIIKEKSIVIRHEHPQFEPTCPRCNRQDMEKGYVKNQGFGAWRIHCYGHFGDLGSGIYCYHCFGCCDKSGHTRGGSIGLWCKGIYCQRCCEDKCTDCKKLGSSQGCKEIKSIEKYYSCCGNNEDITLPEGGCTQFCQGCNENIKLNEGCSQRYVCCKGDINKNKGCQQRYKCCKINIKSTTDGCCYQCCNKKIGAEGCEEKYSCCDINTKDNNNAKIDGCAIRYSCCNAHAKDEKIKGCKLQWKCCQQIADNKNINDVSKCCYKKCKLCNTEWGKGPGCSRNKNHNFENIVEGSTNYM